MSMHDGLNSGRVQMHFGLIKGAREIKKEREDWIKLVGNEFFFVHLGVSVTIDGVRFSFAPGRPE